ncbi:Hypothetical protein NTJ_06778 [Nesidiocoris tenuis]|uniref:Uncharacterized protein n=1 Tax=Nesidiocoris tenuis TaxID=355587 RepID=A0ABN7AU61_9HEMI|nr:Hypothetical protein NTJ_06777 [Nesidiocoris tenuis]BES93968.1 Hypothetical protein NTJ_06778 [Nesidiocoris tenuis]
MAGRSTRKQNVTSTRTVDCHWAARSAPVRQKLVTIDRRALPDCIRVGRLAFLFMSKSACYDSARRNSRNPFSLLFSNSAENWNSDLGIGIEL